MSLKKADSEHQRSGNPSKKKLVVDRPQWRVSTDLKIPRVIRGDRVAERVYRETAEELIEIGIFTDLDKPILARYAKFISLFERETETLENGDVGTGLVRLAKLNAEIMRCGSKLGLSPADRTKFSLNRQQEDELEIFLKDGE